MRSLIFGWVVFAFIFSCHPSAEEVQAQKSDTASGGEKYGQLTTEGPAEEEKTGFIIVPRDIRVEDYFSFMDSCIDYSDTLPDYSVSEYTLVHNNPWIIDSLRGFDYYEKMKKGIFIYDQRQLVILHQGDTLFLPGREKVAAIEEMLAHIVIDVNIPEYKLRIIAGDSQYYSFPVRVGRNERKFLKTAGREVSLRTPVGKGYIVRVAKDPWFVNPVTGHAYSFTRRDDGKYTRMPKIPWLEPVINGLRPGSLIHPTTNPETLGKAYSNGCIGTPEGDAWIIYYYAPPGTQVNFRYDLEVINEQGDTLQLTDIYDLQK